MKSEWVAKYDGNKIKVTNSWFGGEKLFVNSKLQDEQLNYITPPLGEMFSKVWLNVHSDNVSAVFKTASTKQG